MIRSGPAAVAAVCTLCVICVFGSAPAAVAADGAGPDVTTTVAPSSQSPSPVSPGSGPVDVLTADRDSVRAEVTGIDAQIRAAESDAAAAQARVDAATATASAAAARSERASTAAAAAAEEVRSYAVEVFVRPPAQDELSTTEIAEVRDAAYASGVLKIVAERRRQVVDTMVAARVVAEQDRAAAVAAAGEARAELQRSRSQIDALSAARERQARLASRLDDRLDAALAEAAALRRLNTRVADDLTAQEVALRSSGPATPPVPASPPSPQKATTVAAAPSSTTVPRPTMTAPGPATTVPGPTTTIPPVSVPGLVTWSDVVKVGGIWVNKSIASNVQGMLAAAKAAGINLGGGGYRDPAGQIAVRMANCGTSDYAIYQMPASQCVPPTARPGTSMHERGLAMDLQSSGVLITSRSDPAFVWLTANAGRFGFYNLPSEPWHWSTNGN